MISRRVFHHDLLIDQYNLFHFSFCSVRYLLIINNDCEGFERTGSAEDVKKLKDTFEKYGFTPIELPNLSAKVLNTYLLKFKFYY